MWTRLLPWLALCAVSANLFGQTPANRMNRPYGDFSFRPNSGLHALRNTLQLSDDQVHQITGIGAAHVLNPGYDVPGDTTAREQILSLLDGPQKDRLAALLHSVFLLSIAGQFGMTDWRGGCYCPEQVMTLAQAFRLNASQVAELRRLRGDRDAALRQTEEKRQQLDGLLKSDNPDAAAVGRLTIEIESLQKQTDPVAVRSAAQKMLDSSQGALLESLRAQGRAAEEAGLVGLIDDPHRTGECLCN